MSDVGRTHKRIMDRIRKDMPKLNNDKLTALGLILDEELSRPPEPEWFKGMRAYAETHDIPHHTVLPLFELLHDLWLNRYEETTISDTFMNDKIRDLLFPTDES